MKPVLHSRLARRRQSRGIALIEALVGILIFSLGILGLVGLQASMSRAQGSAKFRADAAYLSTDLLGQMWADRGNLLDGKYEHPGACASHPKCADWLNKLAASLPEGSAKIATNANGDVSLTVTWTTSAEGTHTYVLSTAIRN